MMDSERSALVLAHLPLAQTLAATVPVYGMERDDKLQVAYEGLVKASKAFDPSRGSFHSYARKTILNELLQYRRMHQPKTISLQTTLESEGELEDLLPGDDPIGRFIEQEAMRESLQAALQVLNEREREIIFRLYILEESQEQIAEDLHLTPSTVSRAKATALEKMREALKTGLETQDF